MPYIGEIAALTAAFLWGGGAILFEEAGKRIGAFNTNLLRILFGSALLCGLLYIRTGTFLPFHASQEQIFWLSLSGVIGLAIGDGALFIAIVTIGPRLATLLLSLAPPITAILAWIFLNERLSAIAIFGIVLTIWGIFWVVNEKNAPDETRGSKTSGVIAGLVAALGQGVGVIFAKQGMQTEIDALSGTILRMIPAAIVLWLVAILWGWGKKPFVALKDKRAALATIAGSIVGPFLGVWFSLIAIKYTEAGVAATLLATVPILILPMVIVVRKIKPSLRAVVGTVIAVLGIALLFMR